MKRIFFKEFVKILVVCFIKFPLINQSSVLCNAKSETIVVLISAARAALCTVLFSTACKSTLISALLPAFSELFRTFQDFHKVYIFLRSKLLNSAPALICKYFQSAVRTVEINVIINLFSFKNEMSSHWLYFFVERDAGVGTMSDFLYGICQKASQYLSLMQKVSQHLSSLQKARQQHFFFNFFIYQSIAVNLGQF